MRFFSIFFLFILGCGKETKPVPAYPQRLPITEEARELTSLPPYKAPIEGGKVVGVSRGDTVPFDGHCMTEDKSFATLDLRISYDELYRNCRADHKALMALVMIQEKALYRGDQIIDRKEADLRRIRDSWWQKNKLSIGIGTGIVLGIVATLLTGKVWAEIEEDQR